MTFSEAKNIHGLTNREWLLGESVTTAEWRERYTTKRVCQAGDGRQDAGGKARDIGYGPASMGGSGEVPCVDCVGEAQAWRALGEWMVGDDRIL